MDVGENDQSIERDGRLDNLPDFMAFIEDACRRAGADEDTAYALRLAVEEVCINLMRHGYRDQPGPIRVSFHRNEDSYTVRIHDRARPFDPSQAPAPDLTSDADARPIGGLGWHLVKRTIDRLDYESDPERGNLLTLMKRGAPARPHREGGS